MFKLRFKETGEVVTVYSMDVRNETRHLGDNIATWEKNIYFIVYVNNEWQELNGNCFEPIE